MTAGPKMAPDLAAVIVDPLAYGAWQPLLDAFATLRRDAPIEVDFETLGVQADDAELQRLFDFLEFKALYPRMYEALAVFGNSAPAGVSTAEVLEAEITEVAGAADLESAFLALTAEGAHS